VPGVVGGGLAEETEEWEWKYAGEWIAFPARARVGDSGGGRGGNVGIDARAKVCVIVLFYAKLYNEFILASHTWVIFNACNYIPFLLLLISILPSLFSGIH
jgi:hypothetical protein